MTEKEYIWDGVRLSSTVAGGWLQDRVAVAGAARDYEWPRMLELLAEHRELVNSSRPDGWSLYAPLHQAAHGGAPVEVCVKLIGMGAWRTLRTARGERPFDIAARRGRTHLLRALEPVLLHVVPPETLDAMQTHFHEVIRERAGQLCSEHQLRLPELEPLLEIPRAPVWFAVPGMYGGFSYELEEAGERSCLIVESWCRAVEGSGQRHIVSAAGSTLVEEGFV
jgi:hypothetical protein